MTQRDRTAVPQENCNAWPMAQELTREHGVLLRQIGLEHFQLETDATGFAAQQKFRVGKGQSAGLRL